MKAFDAAVSIINKCQDVNHLSLLEARIKVMSESKKFRNEEINEIKDLIEKRRLDICGS